MKKVVILLGLDIQRDMDMQRFHHKLIVIVCGENVHKLHPALSNYISLILQKKEVPIVQCLSFCLVIVR